MRVYKKPPVTEAVLEFQLPEAVPMAALERTKNLLSKRLPLSVEEKNYAVHVDADQGTVKVDSDPSGFRLLSAGAGDETVVLRRNALSAAKLAPYKNWDELLGLAKVAWEAFEASAKPRGNVSRVGLRYINRLDVPWGANGQIEVRDYLNFVFEAPQPPLKPSLEFLVSMDTIVGENDECGLRIISTAGDSPVPRHNGLILDIDVFSREAVTLETGVLWTLVERMRGYKNLVFEACITDNSRKLFSNA